MTSTPRLSAWICLTVGFTLLAAARGEEPSAAPSASESPSAKEAQEQALTEEAREHVERLAVVKPRAGREPAELKRTPRPVLSFTDPTQSHSHGSIWLWTDGERPQGVLELYHNGTDAWIFVVNNLSGRPLRATRDGEDWWLPEESDLTWKPVPDAEEPAMTKAARRRQMRTLARRFSAHEFWMDTRIPLRLLPRPIYQYADEKTGTAAGGVFVLASGTNPEIVLLLEASRGDNGFAWRYAAARLGHAEMHLSHRGKNVWTTQEVGYLARTDSYWLFYEPREIE